MKLRSVSKLWNNYVLAWRILKLKADDDNWNLVTGIKASNIYLHIYELSKSIRTDNLNVDFALGIKKLVVDEYNSNPKHLYHILSSTNNLEALHLNYYLCEPFTKGDSAWAANLQITEAEQGEWLKKLKYVKIYDYSAKSNPANFIRKLLKPCQISSIDFTVDQVKINTIFFPTCFNYGENYVQKRNSRNKTARFIRDFLEDHKTTVKEITLNKNGGAIKMKVDYDPESETIQIHEISLESIVPVRKLSQGQRYLGILDVIRAQTSIQTLVIGKFNGLHIDAFGYRDLLVRTILPNNATTLRKLEIYMDSDNPQTKDKRMSWKGSMFSSLHSLQSLCLRSNRTVPDRLQVFDQINLLPSSLTVLKTSYCISFPFGMGPVEEEIWPNLETLEIESVPWFVFNDGATPVNAVNETLISFLSNFKNLKEWEFAITPTQTQE